MLEIGQFLVIDNKDYLIASKTIYEDKIYLYLVNNNDIMFCYVDNDEVVELDNIDEFYDVIDLLSKEAIKYLNENKKGN